MCLQVVDRALLRDVYFRRSGRLRLERDYALQRDPLRQVLQREFGWDKKQVGCLLDVGRVLVAVLDLGCFGAPPYVCAL